MVDSPTSQLKSSKNRFIGVADVLLAYTMVSSVIFLLVGVHLKLSPNFLRTLMVLSGPGFLCGAIYLNAFGVRAVKRAKPVLCLVILLTILVFVSSLKHSDSQSTKESLKFFVGYCLFGFFLATISNMSVLRLKRLILILTAFSIGFLVYAIHERWPIMNRQFVLPGVNNAQIGLLFYFFALCALFDLHSFSKSGAKLAAAALLIVCFVIGLFSGTRTALSGFLICLLMYVIYVVRYSKLGQSQVYLTILGCCLITSVIAAVWVSHLNESINARLTKGFKDVKGVIAYTISGNSSFYNSIPRLRIWNEALESFREKPMLGSGFGVSYHDDVLNIDFVHPHNMVLEILAEIGYAGFFVFFWLFRLILIRAIGVYRQIARENRLIFLFIPISLLFFFSYSTLHSDLSTEYFKWYFAGFITGFDPKQPKRD